MSVEITKICRTCLALEGALLSIYESKGSSNNGCIADMLAELGSVPPRKFDGMPEKICLACISEINRCYSFKIKCDNSDRTLRQLLNIDESKEYESKMDISNESTSSDKLKAKKKATSSLRMINQEIESAAPAEHDVFYSVQAEEDLEASYYVIGSVEDDNENEEEDCKIKIQEVPQVEYEQQPPQEKNEIDETNNLELGQDSKKQELKCPECPMTFVRPRNLSKHIQKVHRIYENEGDQSTTSSKETDQKDHEQEDQQSTGDEDLLEEIEQPSVPRVAKQLVEVNAYKHRCPHCGAGFALPRSLKYHIQHNKCTEKQYSCSKCQKVFVTAANLRSHARSHSKDHTCDICNETFSRPDELRDHKTQKHGKLKNQCPTCLKVFTMLSTLKDHMRTHSGERPFLCPICGKGFTQNPNLKQHMMRHNKTKPFKCEECENSFVSKGELFSHMRSHTGDHPFCCDVCKASFTTSSSLVKHKRTHTGERPYACEFCPMRFTALNTLKNHRRTHTGERPFKCKYCRRGFAQKSDCVIHMRTHTGERRYICQVCGSTFQQLGTLRIHMKIHREEKEDSEELEISASAVEIIDADEQQELLKDEHRKPGTSVDMSDMVDEDFLHYAIDECSSENNGD